MHDVQNLINLLLILRSGSMVGDHWKIAFAAANVIMNSLQENDFFNVIQVKLFEFFIKIFKVYLKKETFII